MNKLFFFVNILQAMLFLFIFPFILLFWIAKIIGNFMVSGSDTALEIISNLHTSIFENGNSNGES